MREDDNMIKPRSEIKYHMLWAITCLLFIDMTLDYEFILYPMIYFTEPYEPNPIHHPNILPTEWLPIILILWGIGHLLIRLYYWRKSNAETN